MGDAQPIEQSWLDQMSRHRGDFVVRLFSVFMQNEPERVKKIRRAFEAEDHDELKFLSHSLKGAAATMGAEAVRSASLALENAAKQRDLKDALPLLEALECQMERTYGFMENYLKAAAAQD